MDVKRYGISGFGGGMIELDDGGFVDADDFDRILAERDTLQSRLNLVEGENDRMRNGLKRLARHDCGCVPCHGQCRTGRAAEIEFQERMQYAAELLEKNS